MPPLGPTPLRLWLAFTLYVSAAYADATPAQQAQMQARIRPLLPPLKTDTLVGLTILREINEIMPGWHPRGEWELWLRALVMKDTEPPGALPQ